MTPIKGTVASSDHQVWTDEPPSAVHFDLFAVALLEDRKDLYDRYDKTVSDPLLRFRDMDGGLRGLTSILATWCKVLRRNQNTLIAAADHGFLSSVREKERFGMLGDFCRCRSKVPDWNDGISDLVLCSKILEAVETNLLFGIDDCHYFLCLTKKHTFSNSEK